MHPYAVDVTYQSPLFGPLGTWATPYVPLTPSLVHAGDLTKRRCPSPCAVHEHRARLVRVAAGLRGRRRHGEEREAVARCIAGREEGDAAAPTGGKEPAAHA